MGVVELTELSVLDWPNSASAALRAAATRSFMVWSVAEAEATCTEVGLAGSSVATGTGAPTMSTNTLAGDEPAAAKESYFWSRDPGASDTTTVSASPRGLREIELTSPCPAKAWAKPLTGAETASSMTTRLG